MINDNAGILIMAADYRQREAWETPQFDIFLEVSLHNIFARYGNKTHLHFLPLDRKKYNARTIHSIEYLRNL